jgi:hypothetical protein
MHTKENLLRKLEELGKQRTAEARGGKPRRDPWIPDSLKEAEASGITDPEVFEAVKFYRESRYRHPNSSNRLLFHELRRTPQLRCLPPRARAADAAASGHRRRETR